MIQRSQLESIDMLLQQGLSCKEIANFVGFSYATVKRYAHVIRKLRKGQEITEKDRICVRYDLVWEYVKRGERKEKASPQEHTDPAKIPGDPPEHTQPAKVPGDLQKPSDPMQKTDQKPSENRNIFNAKIVSQLLLQPERIGIAAGFRDLLPIHGEWIYEMVFGTGDYTLQAHRAAYKSSCLAVALGLIMILYPTKNIIFIRKADNDVSEMLRMVSKILGTSIFGSMVSLLYQGTRLTITEEASDHLSTNLWTSPMGAPQLLGIGMKASITGKHAAFVVTDDICNVSDRISKAERERTKLQYQELQNIRNRGGRIINLGTPWHKEDVFSLMPNIHRYDCYTTGLITPEKLQEIRQSMAPSLFAANYELVHIASEEAWFGSAPATGANPEKLRDGLAHIDAAYGGEDYTAFTCANRIGNTIYLYGRLWKKHVSAVLPLILEEVDRLLVAPIYCESNGDKGFLKREITMTDHWAKEYTETQNKMIKISTWLRKWWSHIVFIEGTDTEYINQILDYTENAEHDDAPDSAACVCRLLGKYGPIQETEEE